MPPLRSACVTRKRFTRSHRSGKSLVRWLVVLTLLTGSIVGVWYAVRQVEWTSEEAGPTMHIVQKGEFLNEITERGNIESASNVEVRCEVKARGSGGATILWIIPEGTNVEPGDKLIEFDASAFESELTQNQISLSNSEAAYTKAQNDLKNAKDALDEYNEGTYPVDKKNIQIKMFTAERDQREAKQALEYTEELARKGYVTELRVEKDQFSLDKAELDLEVAQLEMMVLDKYTKPKKISQLKSAIDTAEASLMSAKAKRDLDADELELVETQIKKCQVYAKEAGQVVYANETNRHGGQEIIVEEGLLVRERQVVIRLPDPKRMQVKANINEAKVTAVNEGQRVQIALDAMADVALEGVVEKVDEYPAPAAWWAGNTKQYQTYIRILDSSVPLKPGLTAEIRIEIERIPDCIQVPVQAIFEHGGKHYCIKRAPKSTDSESPWIAHEVKIGSTNDKFVVITSGLNPGDQIVHGAFAYRDKVDLPELPPDFATPKKRPSTGPKPSSASQASSGKKDFFKEMDKNNDGKVSKDEVPSPMQAMFDKADSNGDGGIDRSEWAKVQAAINGARGGAQGGGPPGGMAPGGQPQGGRPQGDRPQGGAQRGPRAGGGGQP